MLLRDKEEPFMDSEVKEDEDSSCLFLISLAL
jgi:hypothetical protein